MSYTQFDWQKKRIQGKLKRMEGRVLYIAGLRHYTEKKVIPYVDEAGEVFIKNPYNINWIDFLSCDRYGDGGYSKLL